MSITGVQQMVGEVCVKIQGSKGEVSLALDDSCKMQLKTTFTRCGLAIFLNGQNKPVTEDLFPGAGYDVSHPSIEELIKALEYIK